VAHFYWPTRHRYPRRQVRASAHLIAEFSAPTITHAVGVHGEMLADGGFARAGFRVLANNVREVDGVKWTTTGHDLDRLVERDGIQYGVEIKNELGYIDPAELDAKLAMCAQFEISPMFIARVMPKNNIHKVVKSGGFCLILGNQQYPPLLEKRRACAQS
jgi:hypothetical protein